MILSFINLLLLSLISLITGAGNPGDPVKAELLFAGDAMQHQAQLDKAKELGGGSRYDYSGCFRLIAPAVTEADYAVCNLEVPLGGGPGYSGYPCFSAPDSFAEALRDAGFDMMLTANNHTLDRRDKAARRTLHALDSLGIDHTGTFFDAAQRKQLVPFIKSVNGIKFAFLNYTYGTNGIEPREGVEVALIDKPAIPAEIKKAKEAGAEMIIVCLHWGIEYTVKENEYQRKLGRYLIDNGADMIIGSHPHVIQPMEIIKRPPEQGDALIVYSLGNFISNMKTDDTRGGAIVTVTVERGSDGKPRLKSATYDTVYAAKPHAPGTNYMVIPWWMPEEIPAAQRGWWDIFSRTAERVFSTYNKGVPRTER